MVVKTGVFSYRKFRTYPPPAVEGAKRFCSARWFKNRQKIAYLWKQVSHVCDSSWNITWTFNISRKFKPIKSDYFYVQRMKPCLLKKKHPLFQPILKRETPQKLCVSSVMGV